MSLPTGAFASSTLTEILRVIVTARQTGCLRVKEGEQEGCVAVENGVILQARAGIDTGLHALFQFVGWREAQYDFQERPMAADVSRDLAGYAPEVLITGLAFKVEEANLLQQAIPSVDAVLCYIGGEGLGSVEVTPADLGLLALADGRRTVREMALKLNLSPADVARNLARFRLAGVLELTDGSNSPGKPTKSAAAAA